MDEKRYIREKLLEILGVSFSIGGIGGLLFSTIVKTTTNMTVLYEPFLFMASVGLVLMVVRMIKVKKNDS